MCFPWNRRGKEEEEEMVEEEEVGEEEEEGGRVSLAAGRALLRVL